MGEPAGCPGAPVGGHQARNTDRRARGNSVRPSGRGPQRSGLWTGSYPKDRRRHEQPAPTLPPERPHARTPARPHARTNGNYAAAATPPAATRTVAIFTLARPSPGCDGLWGFCGARQPAPPRLTSHPACPGDGARPTLAIPSPADLGFRAALTKLIEDRVRVSEHIAMRPGAGHLQHRGPVLVTKSGGCRARTPDATHPPVAGGQAAGPVLAGPCSLRTGELRCHSGPGQPPGGALAS